MTNQNNAAQPVLTDDEIRSIWVEHGLDDEAVEDFARAIESALLSKLRATVADERALDLLDTLFTAYENGTPCYEEPDSQGGYLGVAFRIDDGTFRACADLLNKQRPRTAGDLASAPVAGEAQPSDDDILVLALDHGAISGGQHFNAAIRFARALLSKYAAPQASEAVRNPSLIDLLIRAQAWMATTRGVNRPNNLIRLIDAALSAQPGAQRTGGSDAK